MKSIIQYAWLCLAIFCAMPALAKDPASCRNVRFADVGWDDITATTALAGAVFEGLGYTTTKIIASVPLSLDGLKSKQIDVSLGYWSPLQDALVGPFAKAKSLIVLPNPNLTGAKTTLAVPTYVAENGLKSFADIAKFQKELGGKIYGIEPGSSANAKIQDMIDKNTFGLGEFLLIQSSEAGMLAAVRRAAKQKKPIVFFGWEPHPMNIQMPITYLTGGDAIYGKNFGEAKVYTVVATDYLSRCPNAGKLVSNLIFTTDIENRLMAPIMDKINPATAAKDFLKGNPSVLDKWLVGITTYDDKPALPAVKAHLGL